MATGGGRTSRTPRSASAAGYRDQRREIRGELGVPVPDQELSRRQRGLQGPNCRQAGPDRRGAGSMPAACRISHTVDAAIACPSRATSPWIRRWPQAGFSRAIRMISALTDVPVDGRPGRRRLASRDNAASQSPGYHCQHRPGRTVRARMHVSSGPSTTRYPVGAVELARWPRRLPVILARRPPATATLRMKAFRSVARLLGSSAFQSACTDTVIGARSAISAAAELFAEKGHDECRRYAARH
jgi:hypothetical protein